MISLQLLLRTLPPLPLLLSKLQILTWKRQLLQSLLPRVPPHSLVGCTVLQEFWFAAAYETWDAIHSFLILSIFIKDLRTNEYRLGCCTKVLPEPTIVPIFAVRVELLRWKTLLHNVFKGQFWRMLITCSNCKIIDRAHPGTPLNTPGLADTSRQSTTILL